MTDTARIYFDGKGVDAPAGSSVIDALELVNPESAAAVRGGEKAISDSRGLPTEPSAQVYGGAIFRIVRVRSRDNEETTE